MRRPRVGSQHCPAAGSRGVAQTQPATPAASGMQRVALRRSPDPWCRAARLGSLSAPAAQASQPSGATSRLRRDILRQRVRMVSARSRLLSWRRCATQTRRMCSPPSSSSETPRTGCSDDMKPSERCAWTGGPSPRPHRGSNWLKRSWRAFSRSCRTIQTTTSASCAAVRVRAVRSSAADGGRLFDSQRRPRAHYLAGDPALPDPAFRKRRSGRSSAAQWEAVRERLANAGLACES